MLIAQDIKEPLRAITVFGVLFLDHLIERSAQGETRYLLMVVASAKRTGSMIDDLQEYSLIQIYCDAEISASDDALEPALSANAAGSKKI